jgi:O-antigen/teichoic acid export membrane protein/4-amino-4-deoxy-L-arabinose transferase-like glycosyltransferase
VTADLITEVPRDKRAAEVGTTEEPVQARVAAHSGLLSVSAALVGVLSYGCTLVMTYLLTPAEFSQFAAAQMLLGVVGIVASALVPLPLSGVVAAHARGSGVRRDGLSFGVVVSALAGVAAAVVTGAITMSFAAAPLAWAVALSALVVFVLAAPLGWLQGEMRFVHYATVSVGEVLARLLFSVVAVLAFAAGAAGAVWGFLIGALVLLAVPLSFYRDITWRPGVLRDRSRWADTGGIAITMCVASALVGADVVIVAMLDSGVSPDAAGFQALATIAKAPVYVAAGAALVAFPLLRSPGVPSTDVIRSTLRSFCQLSCVAFALIATAPTALVAMVLPDAYHGAIDLLPQLAVAGLGYSALTLFSTVLLGLGDHRRCQLGLAVSSVVVTAGILLGWSGGGVAGLATGCAVGAALAGLAMVIISSPFLPAGTATASLVGAALLATLVTVMACVSLVPGVWLILAVVLGLGVLLHQRGALPPVFTAFMTVIKTRTGTWAPALRAEALAAPPAVSATAQVEPDRGLRITWSDAPVRVWAWAADHYQTLLISGGLAVLALSFRLAGLLRANELFIDEVTYASLAEQIAQGQIPQSGGDPFFLHPPASFILNAVVVRIFGLQGDAMELALQLRWANAVLGSLMVVVCYLVARRLAGRGLALFTGLVMATDPFILKMDGRLMIETPAALATMTGWLLLLLALGRGQGPPRTRYEIAAGLLFGSALVTKDMTLVFTVVPLLAAVVWRRTVSWNSARLVLLAAATPYLFYLAFISVSGLMVDFVGQKRMGLLRMVGAVQETGFNAAPGADLVGRLIELAGQYGTSYLFLAVCPLVGLLAALSTVPDRRLMGLLALVAGLFGMYCVVGGALEEQFAYYVLAVSVVAAPCAAAELVARWPSTWRPVVAGAVVVCAASALLGAQARSKVDDGLVQVRSWMSAELPADARVGLTSVTTEFAFLPHETWEVLPSLRSLRDAGADYVQTQSYPLSQGYGYAAPELLGWLEEHAVPVFTTEGPSGGDTVVWRLDPAELDRAVAEGLSLPPVTGGYQ